MGISNVHFEQLRPYPPHGDAVMSHSYTIIRTATARQAEELPDTPLIQQRKNNSDYNNQKTIPAK